MLTQGTVSGENASQILQDLIDYIPILIGALVILVIGLILIKIIMVVARRMMRKTKLDPAAHAFLLNALKVVLLVALGVAVLQQLGVATTAVIAILSATGAAIALAVQDSLANVAGGFLILLNKPFKRGDEIAIFRDGALSATGLVDDIDLMVTRLHTHDNQIVTVPNGIVTNSVVNNYTQAGVRRVTVFLLVHYGEDMEKVRETLLRVADGMEDRAPDRQSRVIIRSYGDAGLNVELWGFTRSENFWDYQFELNERVKTAFESSGIEIPYPQVDVHQK